MRTHLKIFFAGGVALGMALVAVAPNFVLALGSAVGASVNVVIIPNAPSDLTATAISQSQVMLSWTNNATNNTGFVIERKTGSSAFAQIATVAPDIATYYDSSVGGNNTYTYRVAAYDGDGFSSYSNAATVTITMTTPPPSGGGSGGGGSSGYVPPVQSLSGAEASFKGVAYPSSTVSLLENGQAIAISQSGPDAKFEMALSNVSVGTNNFAVYAVDPAGVRSTPQTFQITMTAGATTVVSGIFFPPTIHADKTQVKKGDVVTLFGYTLPKATVTITVHSTDVVTGSVSSTDEGIWQYQVNTDALAYGDHAASAYVASGTETTPDSALVAFMVGNTNVAAPTTSATPAGGDLNGDGRVNLIDFSVLAYWYGRPNPPAALDLNHDGKVDLTDFSILAYYWTG